MKMNLTAEMISSEESDWLDHNDGISREKSDTNNLMRIIYVLAIIENDKIQM